MKITKSEGVTPTENLLAKLCENTFLKLWSYPNPIKDDKKELCDLLAIFGNHVFIFYDRENLSLKKEGDTITNWERWKKKAIDMQIKTAHGAEKYIRRNAKIFLDVELKSPFPIKIDTNNMIVHKIVIAHGAKDACREFSDENVFGSLAIIYGDKSDNIPFPFLITLDKNNPVHIFDSENLELIFKELDTFYDFSRYLEAKISAINNYEALIYCGEEDLLAHYMLNYDESNHTHFIGYKDKKVNMIIIGEGEWKDFEQSDIFKRKKKSDEISYVWDGLIQKTCQYALDGITRGASIFNNKNAIYYMAMEPRFHRRELSDRIVRAINNFPQSQQPFVRLLTYIESFHKNRAYLFLQLKIDPISDYDNEYRPYRQQLLEIACGVTKNKFKQLHSIIGIATEPPKLNEGTSEDFIYLDCSHWTKEDEEYYDSLNAQFGFLKSKDLKLNRKKGNEFPD
ncbi:MAG: hypothetical protein PHU47_01265 [Candidatus ainarchaeum sp.]|nr:hypothetical protein [Candidatus ainarchaeum sp.]